MKFRVLGNIIYIDTYFIPKDEKFPICGSTDLYKNGHSIKTIKHCTYYTTTFENVARDLHLNRQYIIDRFYRYV